MARHAPIEFINEDRRECRICGKGVVGIGPTLRHQGEGIRVVTPAPEDAKVFARAVALAEDALSRNLSIETTDADRARLVVEAIYAEGLLRRKIPAPRSGKSLADRR